MTDEPGRYQRRSIRLKSYDYADAGAYFVTICTRERECLFSDPIPAGIILDVWKALPAWFPTIVLDEFVVMPNHVHLIVWLQPVEASLADAPDRAGASPAPTWVIPVPEAVNEHPTLGDVIGAFKSLVFTVYLDWVDAHDPKRRAKFWQHNYYEHIIRNENELQAIRQYIRDNPLKWVSDRDNPANQRPEAKAVSEYFQEAGLG